jgi:ankyrin repeat protein
MGTTTELYEHGLTALMMASKMAFLPIVKILVEAGARIDLADAQQQTAVVHAARNSSFALDVVTFLVEKGADPNAMIWDKLNGDKSLLLHAVVNNQTDLAMLLLQKGANASFSDEDGVTVATHAAFLGNLRVVRDLISRNADIASANFEGTDPLIAASAEGHVEIVAELLKSKRVNIHNKDIDGTNALMAASVRGHKEVAKLLVSAGVNVNAQNSEGHTALMFAFNGKHQVELLLEKYREYQKSVEDNSTALLRNALAVHTSIIQLLRRSGADAKLTDNWGHEASDFDKVKLGSTEASGDAASEEL